MLPDGLLGLRQFLRYKESMKARDIVQVKVQCRGKLHVIGYRDKGPLVLYDHRDKKEDALLDIIDGETCRCRQILQFWKNVEYHRLPQKLAEIRAKQSLQASLLFGCKGEEPEPLPMQIRVENRIRETALSCIRQTDYRRAAGPWAGGDHQDTICLGPTLSGKDTGIDGGSERVWSKNGKWSGNDSWFIIHLKPLEWWKVYKAGIAVVEKSGKWLFVLKILEKNKDSFKVLAGRQGKGFNLYACKAIVKKKEGKFQLRWIKG